MYIDNYKFGEIIISGKKYTSDVIIYPDYVNSGWWRKTGHSLDPTDLTEVLVFKPEVIIVGTGAYGVMKIPQETSQFIAAQGIDFIVRKTKDACDDYNSLSKIKKAVACLHLTC